MNRIKEFLNSQIYRIKERRIRKHLQEVCIDYMNTLSQTAIRSGNLKAVKYIPELMNLGEKIIRWLLNDKRLESYCGSNFYYEMIFQLSFRSGVLMAEKWYADFDNFSFDYAKSKLKSDFMDYTTDLMKNVLKLQMDTGRHGPSILLDEIYENWCIKLDSEYDSGNRSENSLVASLLAVYVIAASMMFEKYGYQLKAYNKPEW